MANQTPDRVTVRFEGEGAGVEDLTWGQAVLWESILASGQSRTLGGISGFPPGTTVADVAEDLRWAVSRHQALRTRLLFDGAERPRQVCSASGELVLEVVEAGDTDPDVVAAAVLDRLQTTPFDYEREWPVRMSVVCASGEPVRLVAVYLHLVIDAGGLEVLIADGATCPRDGSTPQPAPGLQPLDQARWQNGPAGRRVNATSLRYQEHVFTTVPRSRFGPPRHDGPASFRKVRFRSPALRSAVARAAAHCRANTSSVLLAGFAIGLARVSGHNPVMAMLTVGNRFRPGLAESVSALMQVSPYLIDVADTTVGDAVARAERSTLSAYKNAYCDPYQQDELYERIVAERGEVDLSCYYNDKRQHTLAPPHPDAVPTAEEITAALPATTHEWVDDPEMPASKVYLYVDDPPGSIDLSLSADLRWFTTDQLLDIVGHMESVAVDAALRPATPTGIRTPAAIS